MSFKGSFVGPFRHVIPDGIEISQRVIYCDIYLKEFFIWVFWSVHSRVHLIGLIDWHHSNGINEWIWCYLERSFRGLIHSHETNLSMFTFHCLVEIHCDVRIFLHLRDDQVQVRSVHLE